ncbi:MAG: SRPBCC family protein, partial [Candidatus Nanopelagicales bacterium]|nr:SRPBCC family protein [Candidatus Nanopelagicales bacterium]
MLINHSFQVDQPIDQVWNFFDDVPLVAACVPGADLTKEIGDDQYEGDVTISAGPVKLEFSGELKIKSRDNTKKVIVLEGAGADKKGRGAATVVLDASLNSLGGSTRVDLAINLTISGAAAQYGRGLVADFTEVLIDQTASSMKTRMTAIAEGRDPMAV